jgi:helicase MOV-10
VFIRHHLAVLKVSLRLPTDFNLYKGTRFELRFRHNCSTLRRQYHALTATLAPPRRLLFPSASDIKPTRGLSRAEINNLKFGQLVNRDIRDDGQQLQAVISILEQPPGSVPFIIYGPSVYLTQSPHHTCTDVLTAALERVRHLPLSKA